MAAAELARFIDRFTMEYVRVYAHPIERVWRAITDPAEFRVWFIPGTLDPRTGGAYRFGDDDFSGVVVRAEPPTLIRFAGPTDGEGYFQYELSEAAMGTRMRFVQHFAPDGEYSETPDDLGGDLPGGPGTPWKPGFVGGWDEFWGALGDFLDSVPVGSRLPDTEFNTLATAWAKKMERMGAFTPRQAERAALSLRRHERWNDLNKIYRAHIKATLPPS